VAGEVALAFVVLTGVLLLVRSFAALLGENPGFDARGVVALDLSLPNPPGQANPVFRNQVMPVLRALPGVQQAAVTNAAPMSLPDTEHSRWATRFGIPGRTWEQGQYPVAQIRFVSFDYFGLLGIPLKRGQWLTPADEGKPRCLINETLAKRFFAGQNPVGQRLVLGVIDTQQSTIEIGGVVGDVHEFGLEEEPAPEFYLAATAPGTVLLKTGVDPLLIDRKVRVAAHAINADIVIRQTHRLQQNVDDSLARRRFALILLAVFAALAAVLTAAGLYGLLAYSVNSRRREFGVRAAIGARPRELVSMVLREALLLTVPGLAAGAILSFLLTGIMRSAVDQLSPTDPLAIGSAAVFLILVTILSGWLPARRAAATDPAAALRAE
jgi:predicted permease